MQRTNDSPGEADSMSDNQSDSDTQERFNPVGGLIPAFQQDRYGRDKPGHRRLDTIMSGHSQSDMPSSADLDALVLDQR